MWQQLTDLLDYYTALGMIEAKMNVTNFLDFCEVMDI